MSHPSRNVFPLARHESMVAGSVSSAEILMGPVPAGRVWRVHVAAVQNQNGTASVCEVSVWRNGNTFPVFRISTMTAGRTNFTSAPFLVPEGCFISALYTTIQAVTDHLHLWMVGAEGPADVLELVT